MSKREDDVLEYLSDRERQAYERNMKKIKAARNAAIRRHKAELMFWKIVDEREDEVVRHIVERRKARQAQQASEQ